MQHEPAPPPSPAKAWASARARADADGANGHTFPAATIHALLNESIARLRARQTQRTDEPATNR
jgi:hypothetical protein